MIDKISISKTKKELSHYVLDVFRNERHIAYCAVMNEDETIEALIAEAESLVENAGGVHHVDIRAVYK